DADQMRILMKEWKKYVIKADYERQLEAAEARRRREVAALEEELRKECNRSAALQAGVPGQSKPCRAAVGRHSRHPRAAVHKPTCDEQLWVECIQQDTRAMKQRGLNLHIVDGDGACLFRS
ncbi:unnamed protein product, partial [Symbiodinium sp. CCMP2592]